LKSYHKGRQRFEKLTLRSAYALWVAEVDIGAVVTACSAVRATNSFALIDQHRVFVLYVRKSCA